MYSKKIELQSPSCCNLIKINEGSNDQNIFWTCLLGPGLKIPVKFLNLCLLNHYVDHARVYEELMPPWYLQGVVVMNNRHKSKLIKKDSRVVDSLCAFTETTITMVSSNQCQKLETGDPSEKIEMLRNHS